MEIELERTFLIKEIPVGMIDCQFIEIMDIYLPRAVAHPTLRIRKRGDILEMTKKHQISEKDSSEQEEHTIALSKEEFDELAQIEGKRFRKLRYLYPFDGRVSEIDVYQDDLKGLVVVDFEFEMAEEKNNFKMPYFCLADVTQDEELAGGMLAGKKYSDIEDFLKKYDYQKIEL
jgi:CYTH domain-containing protein